MSLVNFALMVEIYNGSVNEKNFADAETFLSHVFKIRTVINEPMKEFLAEETLGVLFEMLFDTCKKDKSIRYNLYNFDIEKIDGDQLIISAEVSPKSSRDNFPESFYQIQRIGKQIYTEDGRMMSIYLKKL